MTSYYYPPLGSDTLSFERAARGLRRPHSAPVTPQWEAHIEHLQRQREARNREITLRKSSYFLLIRGSR